MRFTFASGGRWDAIPAGPRLLVLESGALQLDVGHGQHGLEGRQAVTLAAGGSFVAPAGDPLSATNLGASPATLLAVTFSIPRTSSQRAAPEQALLSGVTAQTLVGGLATEVGVGSAAVSLGLATLARDARLSLASATGPILLAVDDGQVDMAAWGTVWVRRGENGMSVLTDQKMLAAGDGLLLERDGLATLHGTGAGTGAVEALILTVRQAPATTPGVPIP